MTGSLHVGLAALGAAIGVGLIGSWPPRRRSAATRARRTRSWCRRSSRSPSRKRSCSTRCSWCSTEADDHAASWHCSTRRRAPARSNRLPAPSASTGCISARRSSASAWSARCSTRSPTSRSCGCSRHAGEQIATGLANAEKIKVELAAIAAERREVLLKAEAEGKQLIEEARAAAARVGTQETQKAVAAADADDRPGARSHRAGTGADARRAEARGRPARGPDHRQRHRQDPHPEDHQRLAEETAHRLAS